MSDTNIYLSNEKMDEAVTSNEDKSIEEKIKELERKVEENFAGWQRARADYQNLKKEWERKQAQFMIDAKKIMLLEILPIYDHLKQAMNMSINGNQFLEWRQGIEQIKNQFDAVLKRWKVDAIPTTGEKFNPEIHEAVGRHDSGDETISHEVQGGYKVDEQLLYPARVLVGSEQRAEQEGKDTLDDGVRGSPS